MFRSWPTLRKSALSPFAKRSPRSSSARSSKRNGRRFRCLFRSPLCFPTEDFRERSEEHTSELQSRRDLVCRLLLEKKKKKKFLHCQTNLKQLSLHQTTLDRRYC